MEKQERIFQKLRRSGARLTKTRQACIRLFLAWPTPLSVAMILAALNKKAVRVNKTTVYRELARLEAIGLVEVVRLGDRTRYFELVKRGHHHHLICLGCDTVEDIELEDQSLVARAKQLGSKIRFSVATHSIEFYGYCVQCLTLPVSINESL